MGKTPHLTNECPGLDAKQYDGVGPVMLELWGMQFFFISILSQVLF